MKNKIAFHKSIKTEEMAKRLIEAFEGQSLSGDGDYTGMVIEKIKKQTHAKNILMTTSGTQALNMALRISGIGKGDEVILPTFAYTSCANSILLSGAKPVFCGLDENLNADPESVEKLIGKRTKAILLIHYGGVPCDMDVFLKIKKKYNVQIIEDAAHAYGSKYCGISLGTIGDYGIYSFHQTKNLTSGEGGCLVIKDDETYKIAEIYHQKGSDRYAFVKGDVPFYQWYGIGESGSPSDLLMALLDLQLDFLMEDQEKRRRIVKCYNEVFMAYDNENVISKTGDCQNINNHLYYIQFVDFKVAESFMKYMQSEGVDVRTHYIPLHVTEYGKQFRHDEFSSEVDNLGRTVIRLPLYYDLSHGEVNRVCEALRNGLKHSCTCL